MGQGRISAADVMVLSLGIAIQNIPEGAIISMPLHADGMGRLRSFRYGVLSGVIEPIGALLTIALASLITPLLPYFLAFAADGSIWRMVIVVYGYDFPEAPTLRISAESKELSFFSQEEIGNLEIAVTHRDIIQDWFVNR